MFSRRAQALSIKGALPQPGSELEALLAIHMQVDGLPTPVRQHVLRVWEPVEHMKPCVPHTAVAHDFRLDFAWPQLGKLAVEVDGEVHRIRDRFHGDIRRNALILLAGWRVLHVDGRRVRSGDAVRWVRLFLETFREPV